MKTRDLALVLVLGTLAACGKNSVEGTWKATGFSMGGQVPDKAAQDILLAMAPTFELKSDSSAQVSGAGADCKGTWKLENTTLKVECDGQTLEFEHKDGKLTTMPDRTLTFERT
jgi:hypothetical protein